MKFFSEVDFFKNAGYMMHCIQVNTAFVIVNVMDEIDIAFVDNRADVYFITKEYKIIPHAREIWDSFLYHYDVLEKYIHNTACTSCKLEKITLTERKIRRLFNIGVPYKEY